MSTLSSRTYPRRSCRRSVSRRTRSCPTPSITADLNRNATTPTVAPEVITAIYRDWIIPLNKAVQVEYLLLPR